MNIGHSMLVSLKPIQHKLLYHLVEQAGVCVAPWSSGKKGVIIHPSRNSAYNSDWSFGGNTEPTVLCLWYDKLQVVGDEILYKANMRSIAQQLDIAKLSSSDKRERRRAAIKQPRAQNFDCRVRNAALSAVASNSMAVVRAIIGEGYRVDDDALARTSSRMTKRHLDPDGWWIRSYDDYTGEFILVRCSDSQTSQHTSTPTSKASDPNDLHTSYDRCYKTLVLFIRSAKVRADVLLRANGKCEYCHKQGFDTYYGSKFLETHHVVPLAEGGPDVVENVVALCANDHRKAHYSNQKEVMRVELQSYLNCIRPIDDDSK